MSRNGRIYFLNQSLKYSTRSAFCKIRSTIGNHVLYCLSPTYGSSQLSHQVLFDFSRIGMRQSIHILIYRTLIAASSSTFAGAINGEWNAPPTFNGRARLAPAAFINSQAFSIPGTEPEITICPGQL